MIPGMISDDERRQTLKNIEERRAELQKQRAEIDEELQLMAQIERQHRAALADRAE